MQNANDLAPERLARLLATRRLGRPSLYFERVGSTNDVARQEADAGAAEGLLVLAEAQMAGRGRLDRRWWAPPGSSLLMSLLLRPDLPAARAGQLTMCLGLGAIEGIAAVTGLPLVQSEDPARLALKWPNDLTLAGRKLGGMLAELQLAGDRVAYAVLGLGLNVNLDFLAAAPDDLRDSAASLSQVLGRPVDRAALLAAILLRCEAWYDALLDPTAGAPPLHAAWAARLETLGRAVAVTATHETLQGEAVGVTPEGALQIRDADGRTHTVWSGDVTSLRPGRGG
jgi:BirA family biotin operon repressor/biotin-[acetyl-CoA-carboxylase] ligase